MMMNYKLLQWLNVWPLRIARQR